MLSRLAPVLVARRRLVLVLAVVFPAFAGAFGGPVAQELSSGGFADPKRQFPWPPPETALDQMVCSLGVGLAAAPRLPQDLPPEEVVRHLVLLR